VLEKLFPVIRADKYLHRRLWFFVVVMLDWQIIVICTVLWGALKRECHLSKVLLCSFGRSR
jgi:hypothetical protein